MKKLLFILFFLFSVPNLALAEIYTNNEYNFSINLPLYNWEKSNTTLPIVLTVKDKEKIISKITITSKKQKNPLYKSYDNLSENEVNEIANQLSISILNNQPTAEINDIQYGRLNENNILLITYAYLDKEKNVIAAAITTIYFDSIIYTFSVETKDKTKEHFKEYLQMIDSFKIKSHPL